MGFWNILFAVPPLAPPEAGMAAEAFRSSVCVLDLPFGRSPRSFRTQFGTPPTRLQDPLEQPTTPSRARWVGHRENSEAVCHGTRPAIGGPRSNGEEIRRPPPQTGHLGQAVGDGRSPTRATVFPRSTVKQISRSEMPPSAARRRGRGKHCATLTDHGLPRTIAFASTAKVPRPGYLLNTTADKQCRGVATRHRRIARTSAAFAC